MHTRSLFRLTSVTCLASLAACSSGSSVDGELKGSFFGRDTQMTIHLDSGGSGMDDDNLGNDGADRDIAPGFGIVGGTPARASVKGSKCLIDPCPPLAQMEFLTPPPLVYAGTWKAPHATLTFTDEDFSPLAAVPFSTQGSSFELTFDEPDFSSSGDVTMVNTGTVKAVSVRNGESLELTGDFRLEYQCHEQSTYYRHCGNSKNPDHPNPINRPYAENTCPADLVAPYEVKPSWSGHTLKLGDFSISCREGNSTNSSDDQGPLLCYQRRTKVSAGGCKWTVHFLTDGALQQFAIAGFAEGDCSQKTCNTYR